MTEEKVHSSLKAVIVLSSKASLALLSNIIHCCLLLLCHSHPCLGMTFRSLSSAQELLGGKSCPKQDKSQAITDRETDAADSARLCYLQCHLLSWHLWEVTPSERMGKRQRYPCFSKEGSCLEENGLKRKVIKESHKGWRFWDTKSFSFACPAC